MQKIKAKHFYFNYEIANTIENPILYKNFDLLKNLNSVPKEMRVSKNSLEIYVLDPNSSLDQLKRALSEIWHFLIKCYEKGIFAPKENSFESLLDVSALSIERGFDLLILKLKECQGLSKEGQQQIFTNFTKSLKQIENSLDHLKNYFKTHLEIDHPELFKESEELITEAMLHLKALRMTEVFLASTNDPLLPNTIKNSFETAYNCVFKHEEKNPIMSTDSSFEIPQKVEPYYSEILPPNTTIKLHTPVKAKDLLADLKKQIQSPREFEKNLGKIEDASFLRQTFIETQLGYLTQINDLIINLQKSSFEIEPLPQDLKSKILELFYYYQKHVKLITNRTTKEQMNYLISKC